MDVVYQAQDSKKPIASFLLMDVSSKRKLFQVVCGLLSLAYESFALFAVAAAKPQARHWSYSKTAGICLRPSSTAGTYMTYHSDVEGAGRASEAGC